MNNNYIETVISLSTGITSYDFNGDGSHEDPFKVSLIYKGNVVSSFYYDIIFGQTNNTIIIDSSSPLGNDIITGNFGTESLYVRYYTPIPAPPDYDSNDINNTNTQSIHSTSVGLLSYPFVFNLNPYKTPTIEDVDVYLNLKLLSNDDYFVNYENKEITITSQSAIDTIDAGGENEIIIKRTTDISKPSVVFSNSQRFNPKYINYVNIQLLFKQQELNNELEFINKRLKELDEFDEDAFRDAIEAIDSMQDDLINLLSNYNALSENYDNLSIDYNDLENIANNLNNSYSSINNSVNMLISDYNDIDIAFNNKISEIDSLLNEVDELLNNIEADAWQLGQIIALHPDVAFDNKEKLLKAKGQSYSINSQQVLRLKNIYPSTINTVDMPDLTSNNIEGFLEYYIVKSKAGIAGTNLE